MFSSKIEKYRGILWKNILKNEAQNNIDEGNPTKILSNLVEDYMYMSSQTYYNWFKKDSNLDNLPVMDNSDNWFQFESIDVPILTFSGSEETDNYLHLDLLKNKAKSCRNFKYKILEETNHFYVGKENEVSLLVFDWINDLLK